MTKLIIAFLTAVCIFSCNSTSHSDAEIANNEALNVALDSIVNKTDPICDMEIPEHLVDTAMIDGKIWGYCSVLCKEKHAQAQR
jgi:YHS domain-containing protein